MQLRFLVIGSGGREHALTWALAHSPLTSDIHAAPGNPGLSKLATCHPVRVDDLEGLRALAKRLKPDLVVIGPEAPLVAGLADLLRADGFRVFGPSAQAARLEASKAFTKALCKDHEIPSADFVTVRGLDAAKAAISDWPDEQMVIKYDGLAAGKGVSVCMSRQEACDAAIHLLNGDAEFGQLVIEERLVGTEASMFVLCDGEVALPIGDAQDYKRAYDNDLGPNTGGMGAVSPAPALTDALREQVMTEIINPTLKAMQMIGCPYTGVLFAGLILTKTGPKLIEYNCRFGDPECQALMPRLMSDLVPLLIAACDQSLQTVDLRWLQQSSVCLTLAASGYPDAPETGDPIRNLSAVETPGVTLFHAGTRLEGEDIVSAGGRVLSLVGLGMSVAEARSQVYEAAKRIDWPKAMFRNDIGSGY